MKSADLGLLRALDALLATGSVTRAAAQLHLSTPAMSHTLARIREMVGDPLLVRAGRKLVPTPRALALREPVAQLLARADALLLPAGDAGLHGIERRFIVRAPESIPLVFGGALATALAGHMPLASIYFVPEGAGDAAALRDGGVDLEIGALGRHPPEAQVEQLWQPGVVGAVRAGHALGKGRVTPARYAAARHVAVMLGPGVGSPVDEALAAAGLRRFVALGVPNPHAALFVAARSDLVASVPERTARAMQASLSLVLFKLPLAVASPPVTMAWHPRHGADAAHRCLRDCVRQVLTRRTPLPAGDTRHG